MKLLQQVSLSISILFIVLGCSHSDHTISLDFIKYQSAISSKNIKRELDFIHPQVIKSTTQEALITSLKLRNTDTLYSIHFDSIIKISPIIKQGNLAYALITYAETVKICFQEMKEKDGSNEAIELGLLELRNEYGNENVYFNKETCKALVQLNTDIYSILSPSFSNWKFVHHDERSMEFITPIIPEGVKNESFN